MWTLSKFRGIPTNGVGDTKFQIFVGNGNKKIGCEESLISKFSATNNFLYLKNKNGYEKGFKPQSPKAFYL